MAKRIDQKTVEQLFKAALTRCSELIGEFTDSNPLWDCNLGSPVLDHSYYQLLYFNRRMDEDDPNDSKLPSYFDAVGVLYVASYTDEEYQLTAGWAERISQESHCTVERALDLEIPLNRGEIVYRLKFLPALARQNEAKQLVGALASA